MTHSRESPLTTNMLVATIIAIGFFFVYNANLRDLDSVDALPATLEPLSLLENQDLTLNEFEHRFTPQPTIWQAGFAFGALQQHDDRIISSYPPGTAILATPVYAAARATGILKPDSWLSYRLTGKLAASAIVALSAAAIFLSVVKITGVLPASMLTAAYGLGTGALSVASQALWQHGPGMLCLAFAILLLLRIDDQERPPHWLAFLLGLLLAMAVVCRTFNVFAAGALSIYLLIYHRRLLPAFLLPASSIAVLFLGHNLQEYGTLSGGYDAILDSQWHRSRNLVEVGLFNHPLPSGLLDTWLSPSKGLLIYSPFVVFALAPMLFPATKHRRLLPFICIWIAIHSIVLAKNTLWWGGAAFGPRYFLELSGAFILLIAMSFPKMPSKVRCGLALSIGISILIHAFGAFYAPCGWAEYPNIVDFNPERHWDWHDTEIERCLRHAHDSGRIPPTFTLNQIFD